ncbi:ornithine cyclodeaminase [Pelistega indica]|uniref:Ornithine cyclodeaminase n=1 Tax=Pelistega indica TaxID=1414851 RepID=V8FUI9_9BURK|nr:MULTISPECIES: ornithine cyclodeaminase family protein [Pelistega]ETD67531.1 ornithine cyclodeaminase [Pelistega indica]
MQIFDAQQTEQALPFVDLINALEKMFIEGCEAPLRHTHKINNQHNEALGTLLIMPAWQSERWLGIKTVSVFPHNHDYHLPGLHSVYLLYSAKTGKPESMFDGDVITSRRTVAASALAAKYLSRPDANSLLIVGSGRVASLIAQAYQAIRPLKTIYVWSKTQQNAEQLVKELNHQGFNAHYADDLEATAKQVDIISCATLSTQAIIKGEWLRPGVHLDLIGSFTPDMRETDDSCFKNTSVFIDTEEALLKAGDLLSPIHNGVIKAEDIKANLSQLCKKEHLGRTSDTEITIFKSVGNALEDLAAAILAQENKS